MEVPPPLGAVSTTDRSSTRLEALEAVRGGTSPWAASLHGCVPCSTSRRHIKGRRAEAGRPPLLKEKEEEDLVDYVKKTVECGWGVSKGWRLPKHTSLFDNVVAASLAAMNKQQQLKNKKKDFLNSFLESGFFLLIGLFCLFLSLSEVS